MNQQLQEKCNLFGINREKIAKQFTWESAYIIPVSSMLYTGQNTMADIEKLKMCNSIVKKKAGAFSSFRGCVKMALVTEMALSQEPEVFFDQVSQIYKMLKKAGWSGSEHLVAAAMAIAGAMDAGEAGAVIDRTRALYDGMKKKHPFLTSSEDIAFAVLLAMSGLEQEELLAEMETCYNTLKPSFLSSNAVQMLSHILALDTREAQVKCRQVLDLQDQLKRRGKRFDSNSLAILGGLVLLDIEQEKLVSEIVEADEYLKGQKGFGVFGIGEKQRLLYAALLVMDRYVTEKESMQMTMITSAVATILAQQMAMILAVTSVNAAMVASNS